MIKIKKKENNFGLYNKIKIEKINKYEVAVSPLLIEAKIKNVPIKDRNISTIFFFNIPLIKRNVVKFE